MWEKINNEIKAYRKQCPKKDSCIGVECIVYRIKNLTLGIFDPSKINIDDFFESSDKVQISFFDDLGDEI